MLDYNKLFAEGNVIGLKHKETNTIISIDTYNLKDVLFKCYQNNLLESMNQQIQYIIRLDEHGNVVEKLFDRERDIKSEPEPMPELKDGMFVKVHSYEDCEDILAFIYNDGVIYQDGKWNEVYDLTEDVVVEVYSDKVLCFNSCQEPYLLWRNPKYLTKSN